MINGEKFIHQPLVKRVGKLTLYVRGKKARPLRARHRARQLNSGGAWEMMADLYQQMAKPRHIVSTRPRPDMLFWSDLEKIVYFIELTVPWEDRVEVANELKKAKDKVNLNKSSSNLV